MVPQACEAGAPVVGGMDGFILSWEWIAAVAPSTRSSALR